MKNKPTHKPHHKPKPSPVAKKKNPLWMVVIVMVVAAMAIVFWRNYTAIKKTKSSASTPSSTNVSAQADHNLLAGRWTRTDSDGAYVIEIKSASSDGKLDASYFNPNPIKVGRAEWQKKNNNLVVLVELRDVNYPGSTYTLNFFPSENRMTGNYYQAVEGANFDVEFVRIR
jgi:hypothetical protein